MDSVKYLKNIVLLIAITNICKNLTYPAASFIVKRSRHKDCPGHVLHRKCSTEVSPGDFVPNPWSWKIDAMKELQLFSTNIGIWWNQSSLFEHNVILLFAQKIIVFCLFQRLTKPYVKTMSYLHSSLSFAVTVRTVCWMSSFSSTSASYRFLSKYGGLSFLSAIPIRMNFDTKEKKYPD